MAFAKILLGATFAIVFDFDAFFGFEFLALAGEAARLSMNTSLVLRRSCPLTRGDRVATMFPLPCTPNVPPVCPRTLPFRVSVRGPAVHSLAFVRPRARFGVPHLFPVRDAKAAALLRPPFLPGKASKRARYPRKLSRRRAVHVPHPQKRKKKCQKTAAVILTKDDFRLKKSEKEKKTLPR